MAKARGQPRTPGEHPGERSRRSILERLRAAAHAAPRRGALPDLYNLPAPVQRYLRRALPTGQEIREVYIRQAGRLRTHPGSSRWLSFDGEHVVVPPATGFVWKARVRMAPLVHMEVQDALADGQGSGRVRLLSLFTVASQPDTPALHSGALHRYLAEAVWYPSALLPGPALQWSPIDDRRALATLADRNVFVSLEFRFADNGEVTGIYTPARWQKVAGGFRQQPWKGHFRQYAERDGILVPTEADVGWYTGKEWRAVWTARMTTIRFQFASPAHLDGAGRDATAS